MQNLSKFMIIEIPKMSKIAKAKARRRRKVLRETIKVSKVWIVETRKGWFYLID